MLPRQLFNFTVFADGGDYRGEIPEITLPTLTRKLEEYRAGGMDGPIDLDFGQEKMEAELKGAGFLAGLATKWGARQHDATMLRFVGALSRGTSEALESCEAVMRGRLAKIDPGSSQAGEKTEQTYSYSLSYFRLTVGGITMFEIDIVNMVCVVDGVDIMAEVRAALQI